MVWTSKQKDLGVAKLVGHAHSNLNVIGRAPAIPTISFQPIELFGAAARCSHLHLINPAVITPESLMVQALVESHVDDVSTNFAILASANQFKDFVKGYFAGTVAAGLSYLAMINDGYVWSDHYENLGGGNAAVARTPDFAFAGVGTGLALMESKGSRSQTSSAFDVTLRDGYTGQLEPHLGHLVGGMLATHGYCIGGYLKSTTKAELRIHHTAVPVAGSRGPAGDPTALLALQRQSFATAFTLAHTEQLGAAIRTGETPGLVPFERIEWAGRSWLTYGAPVGVNYRGGLAQELVRMFDDKFPRPWSSSRLFFAVEEQIALRALRAFIGGHDRSREAGDRAGVPPFSAGSPGRTKSNRTVAQCPDGLAVLDRRSRSQMAAFHVWDPQSGQLTDDWRSLPRSSWPL